MKTSNRSPRDPLELDLELAFRPGKFIHDHSCGSFVSGLEEVVARIDELIGSDPLRAVEICVTVLAGCREKANELDDSSGSFGQFASDLICRWIKARQASGADPKRTAAILVTWMDDDPFCFCSRIEVDVTRTFDKLGLAALEEISRSRFEALADQPGHIRKRWSDLLRAIYLADGNMAAYVAFAEETGVAAADCLAVAQRLVSDHPDQALEWVRRGIDLESASAMPTSAGYGLIRLQRELQATNGRSDEALASAWSEYRKYPRMYSYDELMKYVPEAQRAAWHEQAVDAAVGADLAFALHLLADLCQAERLASLVLGATDESLERVSHFDTEAAAELLEKTHPLPAARLWRAQGMRIINKSHSKYYDAALSNFESARQCYDQAGLASEWEQLVRQVRVGHRRKIGFMPRFEAIVAGSAQDVPLSFLENARARWSGARADGL